VCCFGQEQIAAFSLCVCEQPVPEANNQCPAFSFVLNVLQEEALAAELLPDRARLG
jgi:hypothetical protein